MKGDFVEAKAGAKKQLNLVHEPSHTYMFDSYEKEELEEALDKVKFFSDVELGITNENFVLSEDTLSTLLISTATFDDKSQKSSNDEMVAAIEGAVYPWFGFSYRLDRI